MGIYDKHFYMSPRVGLTLKRKKGPQVNGFEALKQEFVMAPYRCIRRSCLSKMKRYRPLIALSIVFKDYYRNKLNNESSEIENDKNYQAHYENALLFGPLKQKKLNQAIKDCKEGQKKESKKKIIDDAIKKFPTTNAALCKLFGALM